MCIIAIKPVGARITSHQVKEAAAYNSDGFGMAIWDGRTWEVRKCLDAEMFGHWIVDVGTRLLVVCHWRAATSGPKTVSQVHPFPVLNGRGLLFHNGILTTLGNDQESDTQAFAKAVYRLNYDELTTILRLVPGRFVLCCDNGQVVKCGAPWVEYKRVTWNQLPGALWPTRWRSRKTDEVHRLLQKETQRLGWLT